MQTHFTLRVTHCCDLVERIEEFCVVSRLFVVTGHTQDTHRMRMPRTFT
jgi:hypothetical protein